MLLVLYLEYVMRMKGSPIEDLMYSYKEWLDVATGYAEEEDSTIEEICAPPQWQLNGEPRPYR